MGYGNIGSPNQYQMQNLERQRMENRMDQNRFNQKRDLDFITKTPTTRIDLERNREQQKVDLERKRNQEKT